MSKYTTEVRFICETAAGLSDSTGQTSVNDVLARSHKKVFNFDYPIYDERYRAILEKKILKHYYTREICAETVGLWKLWLDSRMNDIMPYYNELYKTTLYEVNPLYDVDYHVERKQDRTESGNENTNSATSGSGESETSTSSDTSGSGSSTHNQTDNRVTNSKRARSDTPQGTLQNLENMSYLSEGEITNGTDVNTQNGTDSSTMSQNTSSGGEQSYSDNSETSGSREHEITSVDEYVEHVYGIHSGGYSQRIKEFRSTLINIDAMIINELSDLFMNIY